MSIYDIIIRPIVTEKSESLKWQGKYTFEVHPGANKTEIKRAVERIYEVDVESVNTMIMPAKISTMRGRRVSVRRPAWKKAVVTVALGQRIEALEA
ncbi:MAG: 50S ribosomal protein L23 [Anaerolineae bacterium]